MTITMGTEVQGSSIGQVTGRVVDLDSHEMVPMHMWADTFGAGGATAANELRGTLVGDFENSMSQPSIVADDVEITYDNVWVLKGPSAPGAIDVRRRPAAMDAMGVRRQLVFPTFANVALCLLTDPSVESRFEMAPGVDRFELGRAMIADHNRWAARITSDVDGSRLRPVGVVVTDSVSQMVADARGLIDSGVRGVLLPSAFPPADTSPADRALDPFYELLAASDTPLLLHLGGEKGLFASDRWSANVPEFVPTYGSSEEFPLQPYHASTMLHFSPENFLIAMVLGGVFERHPRLRFGMIESGAHWIGHTAEKLDMWSTQFKRLNETLTMKPSEYIARNVRVTPFVFEPVALYFERYPNLVDVYCYSSDYPHREGGKESMRQFAETLQGVDSRLVEKFFVTNGTWLVPD